MIKTAVVVGSNSWQGKVNDQPYDQRKSRQWWLSMAKGGSNDSENQLAFKRGRRMLMTLALKLETSPACLDIYKSHYVTHNLY